MTDDRAKQARKAAERPELRIVSRAGEELVADALGVVNFHAWGCNDYALVEVDAGSRSAQGDVVAMSSGGGGGGGGGGKCYVVLSPKDLVLVMPRDRRDHVAWLVERKRYEEALKEAEALEAEMAEAAASALKGAGTGTAAVPPQLTNGTAGGKQESEVKGPANDVVEVRDPLSSSEIGQKYIEHLVGQGAHMVWGPIRRFRC